MSYVEIWIVAPAGYHVWGTHGGPSGELSLAQALLPRHAEWAFVRNPNVMVLGSRFSSNAVVVDSNDAVPVETRVEGGGPEGPCGNHNFQTPSRSA